MLKLSVITPSYNCGQLISRSIKSVLHQKYEHYEHIIIDGGSTDNTIDILKQYPHLIWLSEPDRGQSHAMNKGFSLATGDIIVYLNADDYFLPGIFKLVLEKFNTDPEIDMVFGNLKMLMPEKEPIIKKPSSNYKNILEHWKGLFPPNPVQYFYKKNLQSKAPFNENNHLAMDHEFLLSISKKAKIKTINRIFGVFDMVEKSKTREGFNNPETYWTCENFKYIDKFLQKMQKKYILQYKREQYEFFMHQITSKIHLENKKKFMTGGEVLFQWLEKYDEIVLYGAGTQAEGLHYLFKNKLTMVVDLNKEKINNTFFSHKIQMPNKLKTLKNPNVLVTPLGHKSRIQDYLHAMGIINILFIEDIL